MNEIDNLELKKLQSVQLDILKVIDRICRNNRIRYSLYAGTLLGAVRHHGFIPWDDDLDVCMPRDDYNKFLAVWNFEKHDGYILQNKQTNPSYMNSFSKVRKDHTTFLEHKEDIGNFHTGIFVDVFPIDRMPKGRVKRTVFNAECMAYQLLCREYIPRSSTFLIRAGSYLILKCFRGKNREQLRDRLLSSICKNNADKNNEIVFIETMKTINVPYISTLLDEFVEMRFEDGLFYVFRDWESNLITKFGNYMELPPESERQWRHKPLVLDFEHNIDEIENWENLIK